MKLAATRFVAALNETESFLAEVSESKCSKATVSRAYEWALVETYRSFEKLMLNILVALLNVDPDHFSSKTGTTFPKHMNTSVCQHLVTGGGYFDFKGRDGLLGRVQTVVPKSHWLYVEIRKATYKPTLEKLVALRNYAAHGSEQSKQAVKDVLGHKKLGSAGSWVKSQGRFDKIMSDLKALAIAVEHQASF